MWQILGLSAIFSSSVSEVIDKVAIAEVPEANPAVLTFYRNLIYVILTFLVGMSGIFGSMHIFITIPIIIIGAWSALHSLIYTYLLRKIELSSYMVMTYAANFAYLFIDFFLLKNHFTGMQITGIVFLSVGGMFFAYDWKTHSFQKQYTKLILLMGLADAIFFGLEYYFFKYYSTTNNISTATFLMSFTSVMMVILFAFALWKGKRSLFVLSKPVRKYIYTVSFSKFFDSLNSFLWYAALSYVAVSVLNSLEAFGPLMILALIVITQNIFKLKMKEDLSRYVLLHKIAAVALICVGGFLLA